MTMSISCNVNTASLPKYLLNIELAGVQHLFRTGRRTAVIVGVGRCSRSGN